VWHLSLYFNTLSQFIFMCTPSDSVGRGMLSFRLSRSSVRSFVHSFIQLPQYLTNILNNFDKTDREYPVAPTGDLIRFCRSEVKGQGHSRPSGWRRHPRRRCWGVEFHLLVSLLFSLTGRLARGTCITCWWLAVRRSRDFQQIRNAISSGTRSRSQRRLVWDQRRREGWRVRIYTVFILHFFAFLFSFFSFPVIGLYV